MFVCIAIILNLLIWPSPDVTIRPVLDPMSVVASTVSSSASNARLTLASALREFRDASPFVIINLGPVVMPVPLFPLWFQSREARELTMEERTARAVNATLAPRRFVGYIGDTVTFIAMGTAVDGQPAHGAKFSFESSDETKLTIDEAGRAALLAAGTVVVTARAGAAITTAPVLIRSTLRRVQTDAEWRADQDSLVGSTGRQSSGESGIARMLGAIGNRLMPTADAQGGGQGADFGHAAPIGQVGTPTFAALEETRLGSVMPQTNFGIPISLVDLGGRGLATSLTAHYNSNTWGAYVDGSSATHYVFDPIQGWPSPGFSLGFGRIVIHSYSGSSYQYMFVEANGTRHDLGVGSETGTNMLQTTDGSHITYVGNALGGTVYFQDGTKMTIGLVNNRRLPTQITDTNGNYIQIAYKSETNYPGIAINYIVDTLGRVVNFNYGEWPYTGTTLLTSISTPAGGATFSYQNVTMNYNFLNEPIVDNAPASFSAVSSVTAPGRPTYNLTYSGYGMARVVSAVSGGGTATVTYNYPLGGEEIIGGPTFTQRTETPSTPTAVYTYGLYGTEITQPNGTKLSLSSNVRELKNSSNQTLSKTEHTYTTDPGGSQAVQSVVTTDETGQQTKVDFDYDAYGNEVNRREYGFKISGQWKVRRRTHNSYVNWEPYISSYIRNRVSMVEVLDALQNTNDADDVVIGRTVYGYDNPLGGMEGYGGTANPPGHLSSYSTSYSTRGNVTGVTKFADLSGGGVTRSNKTDIFGGVTVAQVACCDQKSFTMAEATYWSKPSQTTTGNTYGIYLTSSAAYNFNTLTKTSETDPNSQTTTHSYDAAQRPTGTTYSNGANTSTSYSVWGGETSSSLTYSEGGSNRTVTETAVYDGWGQKTSSVDLHGGQTNYTYDNMGRMLTRTNPFPQGGTPGPASSYQYDLLGRNTLVTWPGGNTSQTTYASSSVLTMTDQVNRKVKREIDGLGRLIKVIEQNVATGNLDQETTYTYDLADQIIGVNQGNQLRSFKYDALGQLLFEKIPEQTPTIADGGVPNQWTTAYTYTDWGAVATRKDARGVITTYGYDSLHRLISISYSTIIGVTTAPTVGYNYDNNQSSSTKGLLLSVTVGSGYSESHSYDAFKRAQSVSRTIDSRNYTTSFQFNSANRFTQIIYPSSRVLNITHDSKDRVTSVGNYLSSVTYDGIGRLSGTTLGNGVTENWGYDANRMQLVSQTATKSGGPQYGLMNLTYSYNAAAGQMGAGSTSGNAGQLISISGTINSTTESGAYAYDNLSRLLTSNQTSNASIAQRRFAHDRWSNRTGVWDAVSGGNQIQSITLQQSGGAPINRIATVTAGSTVTYHYDAAGNVINDGVHTYGYDSENRVISVDGGSTATYAYDQANQRYKKVSGGSTTHYIWQDSHVLAEYNGSSGALLTDYIYSGDRMVAKVGSGATSYFLSDPLGLRLILDAGGNLVGRQGRLPFGEHFAENGIQEKHHFTTYERDAETGLDYAVNRIYSLNIGRFIQSDPYRGGCSSKSPEINPQKHNRYSYVENDPVNKVDPLGLMSGSEFLCIIAPILCEVNGLPGGGPRPNPDGYSGWHLGFGDDRVGVGEVYIRIAKSTYQYYRDTFFGCLYKLLCVFNTRATCGEPFHLLLEKDRRNCPRYIQTTSWYYHVKFGWDGCVDAGVTRETKRPEPCS